MPPLYSPIVFCEYLYLSIYLTLMKISTYTCLWNIYCKLLEGDGHGHCWHILNVCHGDFWVSSAFPFPPPYFLLLPCLIFLLSLWLLYSCFLFPIASVILDLFPFWFHYYGQGKPSSVPLWSPVSLLPLLLLTSS